MARLAGLLLTLAISGCTATPNPQFVARCTSEAFVRASPATPKIRSLKIDVEVSGCAACVRLLSDWQLDFVEVGVSNPYIPNRHIERFFLKSSGDPQCRTGDPLKLGYRWPYAIAPKGYCLASTRDQRSLAEAEYTFENVAVNWGTKDGYTMELYAIRPLTGGPALAEARTFYDSDESFGRRIPCSSVRPEFPRNLSIVLVDAVAERRP